MSRTITTVATIFAIKPVDPSENRINVERTPGGRYIATGSLRSEFDAETRERFASSYREHQDNDATASGGLFPVEVLCRESM